MKNTGFTVFEPSREIPVADVADVCVLGGSCTGVFAALKAAEYGMRVALVENNGFWGGSATAACVPVWHSLYSTDGREKIINGLTSEFLDRLAESGNAVFLEKTNPSVYAYFSTTALMRELDAAVCAQPLIRPFLHTRFAAALSDRAGHVTHAVIEDKSGRRAISARFFIDATGDADLLRSAGFATRSVPRERMQPHTTCAVLSGVGETEARYPEFSFGEMMKPERGAGLGHVFQWSAPVIGSPSLRFAAVSRISGYDPCDPDDLTRAEIEGRRQVAAFVEACNRQFPCEGSRISIAAYPSVMGIRESCHACCMHRLTDDEVLYGRKFDDVIARGSYRVDIHHGAGITFKYLDGRTLDMSVNANTGRIEWTESRWRPETDECATFYEVPYRCIVPEGSENVLCAGRMADCESGAYGAVRVMVNCNQMGEAAGAAAANAVANGLAAPDACVPLPEPEDGGR